MKIIVLSLLLCILSLTDRVCASIDIYAYTEDNKIPMPSPLRAALNTYHQATNRLVVNPGYAQSGQNVHHFNKETGIAYVLKEFMAQDRFDYGAPALARVLNGCWQTNKFIYPQASEQDQKKTCDDLIRNNLSRLFQHVHTNVVESTELKVDMRTLTWRTWQLACALDRIQTAQSQGTSASPLQNQTERIDNRSLFINSVIENSQEGGGCYPGFSGRMARIYIAFIAQTYAP